MSFLTKALFSVIGLCLAIPGLTYFVAPLRRKQKPGDTGQSFVDAGAIVDLPIGEWRLIIVEVVRQDGWEKTLVRNAVWVRREAGGEPGVQLLSSICPHLGCSIAWHRDQARFICPCHKALFDADGRRVSGPSPRAMDPLPVEVHAGRLRIRWQDFRTGKSEQMPINA